MPDVKIEKEKCMKVHFKKYDRIMEMFRGLPKIFQVEEEGDMVTVYCPVGYEIRRDAYKLTPLQFRRIYNQLKVERGRKLWKGDYIILDPMKDAKVIIRMSSTELDLLKTAARNSGENLSDYVRAAAFTRMARELGL